MRDMVRKTNGKGGFGKAELAISIVLVIFLTFVCYPKLAYGSGVIASSQQVKQVSNAKQILTSCALFAADLGAGRYPNGNFDPASGEFTSDIPAASAEACFQDLFESGMMEMEVLFWLPQNQKQCDLTKPDENGVLDPGETYWDFVGGMKNDFGGMLLLFEASDSGDGKVWTWEGGHPWKDSVVVGYADGSSVRKERLNSDGTLKKKLSGGEKIDLCVPTPGKNGWPEHAVIAPATQVAPDWIAPSRFWQRFWQKYDAVIVLGVTVALLVFLKILSLRARR